MPRLHIRAGQGAVHVLWLACTLLASCASTGSSTPAAGPLPVAPGTGAPAPSATVAPGEVAPAPAASAPPGTVIDTRSVDATGVGRAVAFTYHSTGAGGRDVAVSGLLLTPAGPAPDGGFPLITWGHPTTGAADGCQPSAQGIGSLPHPDELLTRGWAVVATDYEGLGSAGPHPYLVGASEGHAVLDAARAAAHIDGSGVEAGGPVVIWGFSQGGHAAAFAAQLAPTYAPELRIEGVAIAAPVSDVTAFVRRAEAIPDQLGVVLTTLNGFAAAYPDLDPSSVLTPVGLDLLAEVERRCIGEINEHADRPPAEVIRTPPTADPAFAARFAENRAGDAPVGMAVLVVQGADDDIVDPATTAALVERWCGQGVTVESVVRPGVGHGVLSAEPYLGWIEDRLAGVAPTSTC